jgi:hypothetical protein
MRWLLLKETRSIRSHSRQNSPDKHSIAAIWSYSYEDRTEWRWLCAADHVGEDGLASEEEAIN